MKRLSLLFFASMATMSYGQYYTTVNFYEDNAIIYNPAAIGLQEGLKVNTVAHKKVNGINGTPDFLSFNGSYNLTKSDSGEIGHGVGFIFNRETVGAQRNMLFSGSYSLSIPLKNSWSAIVGTSVGFREFGINQDLLNPTMPDPVFGEGWAKDLMPDFSLGTYIKSRNVYSGFGIQQLFEPAADLGSLGSQDFSRQYYIMVGGQLDLSPKVSLNPSALMTTSKHIPNQFKGGLSLNYNQLASLGVLYTNNDAVALLLSGTIMKKYKIGYSYTHLTTALVHSITPDHELNLSMNLNL